MRKEYEMTDDEMNTLLNASKWVSYMVFGGIEPRSPQERANDAWKELGHKKGFDGMTVRPIPGKSSKFFTAEEILS